MRTKNKVSATMLKKIINKVNATNTKMAAAKKVAPRKIIKRSVEQIKQDNFIETVSRGWSAVDKQRLATRMQNAEYKKKIYALYNSKQFTTDLRTGMIHDVKNFAINLDYPGRNFRDLYALDWASERNKTANLPVTKK